MSKQFIFKNKQSNKPTTQVGSSTMVIDKEEVKMDKAALASIEAIPLANTLN